MYQHNTIKDFISKTASKESMPGGGVNAALSGAMACALTEMVINFTIDKKGYDDVQGMMKEMLEIIKNVREEFLLDMDRDADSFNNLMDAYRMRKDTEEEKIMREHAIQDALKNATLVPLNIARRAYDIMDYIEKVIEKGNKNLIIDGVVAAFEAKACAMSALCSVMVNIKSIKDENFVSQIIAEASKIKSKTIDFENRILKKVSIFEN